MDLLKISQVVDNFFALSKQFKKYIIFFEKHDNTV